MDTDQKRDLRMASSQRIRVLIADDHPIVRQGLELVINSQPDLTLVGQAANGEEVIQKFSATRPDIVVMDLHMPVMDGLTAIKEIIRISPGAQILAITSFPDDEMVIAAIQAGASGMILKDAPPDHLLSSIRAVAQGESALHPWVAKELIKRFQQPVETSTDQQELTQREIEVLKCLAAGLSNRAIADELSISTRTVTTHVRNILDKLNLENRTQAALYAVERGIVSVGDHPKSK